MGPGHVLQAQAVQRPVAAEPFTVNSLLDYREPQFWGTRGERFESSMAQWELHCTSRTARTLSFTAYAQRGGQGAVVAQQAKPTDWAVAPPGSIPAELLSWACR